MPEKSAFAVIISCEHGGNEIPASWRQYFSQAGEILQSHRGYDPGALQLAQSFSRELQVPLMYSTVSRLLIELNRSPGHPKLFSEFTRCLGEVQQAQLVKEYYQPYRSRVQGIIEEELRVSKQVIHLSVHSFTPVWEGVERPIDIGLLYDPKRPGELAFCSRWYKSLKSVDADLRVRRNAPYKGIDDGFVTYLRTQFSAAEYIGIELEVNQRYPLAEPEAWKVLQKNIIGSFLTALDAG